MLRTMITATNTLSQVQHQLDTISTNIANSNTHGYKAQQANFTEMLYQQFNNDEFDKTVRQYTSRHSLWCRCANWSNSIESNTRFNSNDRP